MILLRLRAGDAREQCRAARRVGLEHRLGASLQISELHKQVHTTTGHGIFCKEFLRFICTNLCASENHIGLVVNLTLKRPSACQSPGLAVVPVEVVTLTYLPYSTPL